MIGSERIFLDTAPIIYFVEHKEEYFEKVFRFFKSHGRSLYFTSVISIAEFFPSPFSSENGNEITDEFNYFVSNMQIRIIDIDREIAEESARIRARYIFSHIAGILPDTGKELKEYREERLKERYEMHN